MTGDPIEVACPGCAKRFRAPAKLAGRQVRCPACATTIDVPAAGATAGSDPYADPNARQEAYDTPSQPYETSADPNQYAPPPAYGSPMAYGAPPPPLAGPPPYGAPPYGAAPSYGAPTAYAPPGYGGAPYYPAPRPANKAWWQHTAVKIVGIVLAVFIALGIIGAVVGSSGGGKEKKLVGTWTLRQSANVATTIQFNADETFRLKASSMGITTVDVTGDWKVGAFGTRITLSNLRGTGVSVLPGGGRSDIPWRIDSLDDKQVVFGTADGKETWRR